MYSNTRTVRIQWGDCDPAGIVFHPHYFEIFDASTAALFESALGMQKRKMMETYNSAGIPVVRTGSRFVKPVTYGDDISIESTITFKHSSFQVDHRISRNGELCAEASETRVWVVHDGNGGIKSSPIPADVLAKFRS